MVNCRNNKYPLGFQDKSLAEIPISQLQQPLQMPDALSPCLFSISKWGYLKATEGAYSPRSSGFIFISGYGHVELQSVATGVQGQRGTGVWCVSSSTAHWSPLGNRSKSARSLTRKISLLGLSASEWRLYRGREWIPHRGCTVLGWRMQILLSIETWAGGVGK